MTVKVFVVPLADLERGPKQVVWCIDAAWLNAALEGTEAKARGTGSAELTLTKDGRQVIVKGRVKAPLTLPCAVTLDPAEVDVDSELLLMLTPEPAHAPSGKGRKASSSDPTSKGTDKSSGRLAKERELSDEEAAQDHYSGDEIVLDSFIREFILLELPMVPLRSDLRDKDKPAIPGPPEQAEDASGKRIDPRLAPLAEIAGRLKNDIKE